MKTKLLTCSILAALCTTFLNAQIPQLSEEEKNQGWILLFDGTTSAGWVKPDGSPFPETGWKIDNGVLSVDPASGKGGDIITTTQYSDFELSVDFKITQGANSGIKYYILPGTSLGCEFQILDDVNHPDAKLGKNYNRIQGALYDLIRPCPSKRDMPIGEWNNARIVAKGNHVTHWLNGINVLDYDRGSAQFNELVAESKFKDEQGFATPIKAPILLQDHGDVVYFRNIKIRKL
ncbi:MAG: DUF1080 domain-containing protein [Dysgonamonadaceae bacterium]|jgi:hypothetical protein|nr:DUF1080 domain-containing protein [Dysgonamonadaceae bacterium]